MATYYYNTIGGNGTGQVQRGTVTAETDAEAEEKVRALYKFQTEILFLSTKLKSQERAEEEGAQMPPIPYS